MVGFFRIDPRPRVANRHGYGVPISRRGPDRQQPPAGNGTHGLDCVHDQIQEHLLQLYSISQNVWQAAASSVCNSTCSRVVSPFASVNVR